MSVVDLILPKLGESIMEATILKWHKAVGDTIQLDETLLDIATDKVDSEIPSSTAGTITEILFAAEKILSFAIISPLSSEKAYPNYQLDKNIKINPQSDEPFKVKSVDGYAMLLNIKKIQ